MIVDEEVNHVFWSKENKGSFCLTHCAEGGFIGGGEGERKLDNIEHHGNRGGSSNAVSFFIQRLF